MLKVDLHVHSVASGHAINTVYELARDASEKDLEMIAVTDHGPAFPGASTAIYFYSASRSPKKLFNVEILMGCETNILDTSGLIDLPENLLSMQDIILAGLHTLTSYKSTSIEDNTKAIIEATKSPYIHIISHPCNPAFHVEMEKIIRSAADNDVALEVNCSVLKKYADSNSLVERTKNMIRQAQDSNVRIVISSDAHVASELGDDSIIDKLNLREMICEDNLLNASRSAVEEFISKSKKKRRNAGGNAIKESV